MTNKETIQKWIEEGRVFFGQDGKGAPQLKRYLNEVQSGVVPTTYWDYDECGHNDEARKELKSLFERPPFDSPKPTRLLKKIITIGADKDSVILDFFSGSASTAHAVMQLNAEDGGHRKFIMVQVPEPCKEKSEAYKAGYKTICDIGKERIRRAGAKIEVELAAKSAPADSDQLSLTDAQQPTETPKLDTGFRVFKLDDSNMRDVYFAPDDYTQDMLSMMESNIKPDRTALDLLFGCLLEWGLPLSMPYRSETIDGCTVHTYNDGDLIACFDENIPRSVVEAIARRQPLRAVFRDSSFSTSPEKINLTEIFKLLAPDTRIKVI